MLARSLGTCIDLVWQPSQATRAASQLPRLLPGPACPKVVCWADPAFLGTLQGPMVLWYTLPLCCGWGPLPQPVAPLAGYQLSACCLPGPLVHGNREPGAWRAAPPQLRLFSLCPATAIQPLPPLLLEGPRASFLVSACFSQESPDVSRWTFERWPRGPIQQPLLGLTGPFSPQTRVPGVDRDAASGDMPAILRPRQHARLCRRHEPGLRLE